MNAYTAGIIVIMFGCVTFLTYTHNIPSQTITGLIGVVAGWALKTGTNSVTAAVRARAQKDAVPPTLPADKPKEDKPAS
jgi:hypothetical protein